MRNSQRPSWSWLSVWLLPLLYLVIFGFNKDNPPIQAVPAYVPNLILFILYLLQIVLMLFLLRGSGRSLGKVLGSIGVVAAYYVVIASSNSDVTLRLFPVTEIENAISLVVISYLAAIVLRHLPAITGLQALQLLNWRGRLILSVNILGLISMVVALIVWNETPAVLIILGLFFFLNIGLVWQQARQWWHAAALLASLFAIAGTGILLVYLGYVAYPNTDSTQTAWITGLGFASIGIALVGIVILISALGMLASTGLHFILEYFPTLTRIRKAGILDWRGAVLLGLLAVNLILMVFNTFQPENISLDAAWPLFAIYMLVVVVLYWQPAKRWMVDRQAVYLFAALAISGGLLLFIVYLGSLLVRTGNTTLIIPTLTTLILYCLYSASACALISLLPWLQNLWNHRLPAVRQTLPVWKVLAGLAVVDYAIVYLAESASLFYSLLAGALSLVGAFFLTSRLERWQRGHALAGIAAGVAVVSLTGILAPSVWTEIAASLNWFNLLSSQSTSQMKEVVWAGINITFFGLPLLAALSLALLLHRRILVRLAMAGSILAGTQLIIIYSNFQLDESGLATGIAWLAIFGAGWLLSGLLPARVENWGVTLVSGFLLLCLSPLLLPVINDETDLFSYPVSLPIWSSQQTVDSLASAVNVFLPILLSVVGGTLFFALMLRSGQAMLQRSRTPHPEIVTLGLLVLGACLTLASSYDPTTVEYASQQSSEGWQAVSGGPNQKEKPTVLFADSEKRIWLGGSDGSSAWVMLSEPQKQYEPVYLKTDSNQGVLSIAEDETGRVWVLTEQALAAFNPATGAPLAEFSRGQLANELGSLPGENLEFTSFYPDEEDSLWLGTSQGLLRLDIVQNGSRLVLENVKSLTPRSPITQVGRDSQGHLWAYHSAEQKLMVELTSPGQLARSMSAGSGNLEFKLDLTKLPVGSPVALNISVQLKEGVLLTAQARAKDGEYRCLDGFQTSKIFSGDNLSLIQNSPDKQPENTCLVITADLPYAINFSFPLDDYAGISTTLRLSQWNLDYFAGDWLLLAAWVSPVTVDGQAIELFKPADCSSQDGECVLPVDIQNMGLFDSASQVVVWTDSLGPVYAPKVFNPANNAYATGPTFYHHAGILGLQPLVVPDAINVYSFFVGDANQVLALTNNGLQALQSETGVFFTDTILAGMTLYDVSTVMIHGERLWVAGKIQSGSSGEQAPGFAIQRYDRQEDEWVVFRNIPLGSVNQMALDADNAIWVLIEDKTYRPNSVWWFIIPVLGFIGIGVSEFLSQPATLAGKLRRRLRAAPQQALPILYEVLRTDPSPGLVLSLLPTPAFSAADRSWVKLAAALAQVASDRPLPSADQLLAIAEALEKAGAPPEDAIASPALGGGVIEGASGVGMLYRFLSAALKASSVMQIGAWSLRILRSQDDLPPNLTSETQQPQPVPGWIDTYTVDTLDVLANVAAKIKNYQLVESSQDKLVYLTDAVTAAGEALRRAENAKLPERTILRVITTDWMEMVRTEMNNVSGRARLRLELRTRQIRRAPQVIVALRLTNIGRAIAESPSVVLLPGDGYTIPAADKVTFERISTGGSALAEFTITPSDEDEARIICQVSWTDRIRPDNDFQFADKVRFYRQAGEFQRIRNPYIAGNPLKTSDLFRGREDVFQFVAESLNGQDRTLVLHGQRRTGKTSVLYQLLNGRLGEQFIPVLVDMQEMAPLVYDAADLFSEIANLIVRALRKVGIEAVEPDVSEFKVSYVRTFRRFLDSLDDPLSQRRVVLLFDEFEILESKIVEGKLEANLLGYFRSLIQHRRGLVFIFTGTHRLEEMSHDYWSVLFNLALYKRISYLKPEEAQRLVREPVGTTLTFDELAMEKILQLTRCHPYFIQLICFNLVNLCNEKARNYATLNDVNDSIQEIIDNGEAHFAYIWQRASAPERAVLAGLAHCLIPGRAWASPVEIQGTLSEGGYPVLEHKALITALDGLVGQEVLDSTGDGSLRYQFQIELIQRWIAANKSVAALAERDK